VSSFGSLPPIFHRLLGFAVEGAAFEGFAFVVEFFSFGQGDGDFGKVAFIEVEFERDNRQAVFVDFGVEFFDLFFVQQQFAWGALFSDEMDVGGLQVPYVGVHEVEFASDETTEGIVEVGTLGTQTFDLSPLENDPGFESLEDFIIMAGFFVLGDKLNGHVLVFGSKEGTAATAKVPAVFVVFFQIRTDHHRRRKEVIECSGIGDDTQKRA